MVSWIIPIVRQSKTDLIHRQEMRPLRHGGSHFVNLLYHCCEHHAMYKLETDMNNQGVCVITRHISQTLLNQIARFFSVPIKHIPTNGVPTCNLFYFALNKSYHHIKIQSVNLGTGHLGSFHIFTIICCTMVDNTRKTTSQLQSKWRYHLHATPSKYPQKSISCCIKCLESPRNMVVI